MEETLSRVEILASTKQRNIAKEPFISTETICSTFGDRSEGSLWFHI